MTRNSPGSAAPVLEADDSSRPGIVDLFSAHLADARDLRAALQRSPTAPGGVARSRPPARTASRPSTAPRRSAPRGRRLAPHADVAGILLVLDGSAQARRAAGYVGSLLGRRPGVRVCLAYVLPEPPPSLLEHGGASDPNTEQRLTAALRAERRRWIAQQKRVAREVIGEATLSLRRAGLSARAMDVRFCGPAGDGAAADEILRLARARRCRTIVVGRRRQSWLSHVFTETLRDRLARRGEQTAIWGIG